MAETEEISHQEPEIESLFEDIPQKTPLESYIIRHEYNEDNYDYKINLSSSFYRNEDGNPHMFPLIRSAEKILSNDPSLMNEELHPFGYDSIRRYAIRMLLGNDSKAAIENRIMAVQTLSTTGAYRIGAEFLVNVLDRTVAYSSSLTTIAESIFKSAGFKTFKRYRYVNKYTLTLDIDAILQDLNQAEEGSVILLHSSAHNPTGFDPTPSEWIAIADKIVNRKLIPFFDCSYQGFASGNLDEDVWPIRYFANRKIEFFCSYSLSKIFNMYNERVGCLIISMQNSNNIVPMTFHLYHIIKSMYASPPSHGAKVIAFILGDDCLYNEWLHEIESTAERLKLIRLYLRQELERQGAPGSWTHITQQRGMFCYTGLVDIQIEYLKKEHHIYLLPSGRLNVSGLNTDNIEYVAFAIKLAKETLPQDFNTPNK